MGSPSPLAHPALRELQQGPSPWAVDWQCPPHRVKPAPEELPVRPQCTWPTPTLEPPPPCFLPHRLSTAQGDHAANSTAPLERGKGARQQVEQAGAFPSPRSRPAFCHWLKSATWPSPGQEDRYQVCVQQRVRNQGRSDSLSALGVWPALEQGHPPCSELLLLTQSLLPKQAGWVHPLLCSQLKDSLLSQRLGGSAARL